MDFDGFDWDKGNRDKCRRHGVATGTIEQLFRRGLIVLPDEEHSPSEQRFGALGRTGDGRGIFVVFTMRRAETGLLIRPISAGYMREKEVRRYEEIYEAEKLPTFTTDREAETFVAEADLTEYDLSGGRLVRFELKPKDASVNLRLPKPLLDAVRTRAKRAGMPYQRFIRLALERAVALK
jgi:hypothetical protein